MKTSQELNKQKLYVAIGALCALLLGASLFLPKQKASFSAERHLPFAIYVGEYLDVAEPIDKNSLGWGALDTIKKTLPKASESITNCRQYFSQSSTIRFEVKVDVARGGFEVMGILEGAQTEPQGSACIRDILKNLVIDDLKTLRRVDPAAYKLRIDILPNIGLEL